jgi:hypothetical protein
MKNINENKIIKYDEYDKAEAISAKSILKNIPKRELIKIKQKIQIRKAK